MALPSRIPRYDSVELLDLDHVGYVIVRPPANATLRAWMKLQEAERRWTMFEWATYVVTQPGRCLSLINDFASAYLLSLEATLQILQDETKPKPNLEAWLTLDPAYDLICRGLRTLRHLEAHVRTVTLLSQPETVSYSRFAGGGGSGSSTAWEWPALTVADLACLKTPRVTAAELPAWNAQASSLLVPGLMRHGLAQLVILLNNAGP
jgi:hypothetical protein